MYVTKMLALTLVVFAVASNVPAVIFSASNSLGSAGYRELPMAVSNKALEGTIEGLLGMKPTEQSLVQTSTQQPVVVLVAEGANKADLQSLVQTAGSAVGLPYAASVKPEASVLASATVANNAEELDQALAGRSTLPALLVVRSPEAFSLLSKVDAVSKDYVAIAIAPPSLVQERSLMEAKAKRELSKAGAEPQLILMSTPILTGLMVGLVWLTIFFSGVCCLMNLHTPDRFEDKVLMLNKEY